MSRTLALRYYSETLRSQRIEAKVSMNAKTNKSGLDISENTAIRIPLANLISLLAATAIAAWAYFGTIERVTFLEHDMDLQEVEVKANSEFRVKWPRGELGSLPADSRQDLKIELLEEVVEKLQDEVEKLKEERYERKET